MRRATRFTSREAPSDIAQLVEQATARLGGRTERTEFECAGVPKSQNSWMFTAPPHRPAHSSRGLQRW